MVSKGGRVVSRGGRVVSRGGRWESLASVTALYISKVGEEEEEVGRRS